MKRFISIFLVLFSLLSLAGCKSDSENFTNFYYIRNSYVFGKEDGVMFAEARNIEGYTDEQDILKEYLNGPQDVSLVSPFPADIEISDYHYEEEILYITLCANIVTLPKAKQVLACACLARTAMELTGVKAVHFRTDEADFAKMDPIIIDQESVLLYDNYNGPAPTEP